MDFLLSFTSGVWTVRTTVDEPRKSVGGPVRPTVTVDPVLETET